MALPSIRVFAALFAGLALTACASSRTLNDSVSDLAANVELKSALFTDRAYDYADVDITIYEGRLLLTGTMRNEAGRRKLLANARNAERFDEVIDEIIIGEKTSFSQGFEDSRIDQTLRAKFIANSDIRSGDYKIAVSQGAVYLLGSARTQNELNQALTFANEIDGVRSVTHFAPIRMQNVE